MAVSASTKIAPIEIEGTKADFKILSLFNLLTLFHALATGGYLSINKEK